jgi:hypothetical protein
LFGAATGAGASMVAVPMSSSLDRDDSSLAVVLVALFAGPSQLYLLFEIPINALGLGVRVIGYLFSLRVRVIGYLFSLPDLRCGPNLA